MQKTNRVFGLDILKLLCAFLVVCIHINFKIGSGYIDAIARIAVPIFFMITGYFYQSCTAKGNQLKQIKKILILMIFGNILYFAFYFAAYLYTGDITAKLQSWFTVKSLVKFLLFNESPFSGHLWYLGAILYVLIFVFLFEKKFKRRNLYILIPILLCINLIFGNFSMLIFGKAIGNIYTRNFLFMGLPFFLLGDYLQNEKFLNPVRHRPLTLGILATTFMVTTIVECFLLKYFNLLKTKELYLSSIFCAIFIFSFCINISNREVHNTFIKKVSDFGKKYSTDIYIFHNIIKTCASKAVSYINFLDTIYTYIAPIIVFIITIIIAIIWETALSKIKQCFIIKKEY